MVGLLSQVAQNVARIPDKNAREDIAAYTEILAGLKFEKNLIRQLLRENVNLKMEARLSR